MRAALAHSFAYAGTLVVRYTRRRALPPQFGTHLIGTGGTLRRRRHATTGAQSRRDRCLAGLRETVHRDICEILPLALPHRRVALERAALVLEPEPRPPCAPTKRVGCHPIRVAEHEARVVAKCRRHVPQLHPAFGPPA